MNKIMIFSVPSARVSMETRLSENYVHNAIKSNSTFM